MLEKEDGRLVEGTISLVEVTEGLLYPFTHADGTEGRKEKAD